MVIRQGRGMNDGNIGMQILPLFGVTRRNAHLVSIGIAQAELFRIIDRVRAPGTTFDRISMTFGDSSFEIVNRGEEIVAPDEPQLDYAGYFDTEAFAAQSGEDRLELTHEYLIASALLSTTTFGSATNSLVAYTEANIATISLIADIVAAVKRGRDKGERYNTAVIPADVFDRAQRSAAVLNFVRGQFAPNSEVTVDALKSALSRWGIKKLLIGDSVYNTAAKGATPVLTQIWSNTYIWVGRTADGAISKSEDGIATVDGVGASTFWEEFNGAPWQVSTYREEARKSNIVRCETSLVPYIANANAGTLIATQYA